MSTEKPESEALFERMREAAREMHWYNGEGALHIFISDGNCEEEHLEFCLEQPDITEREREFATRMLHEFTSEQLAGVWAFAQCKDLQP